jgi:hypothetical protein
MQKKMLLNIILTCGLTSVLFGCALGANTASNTPLITAALQGQCGGSSGKMSESSCTIVLTYSTGGDPANNQINISCLPSGGGNACLGSFNINTAVCQPLNNTGFSQTCNVPVNYQNNPTNISEAITFYLGSATSNPVNISNF